MKLMELPLGARVRESRSGEVFLLADHRHTGYHGVAMVADNVVMYSCFDAAEPTNPDEEVALAGNNDYPLSNIHAWLNSEREDWFEPTHEFDAPPTPENIDCGDTEAFDVPFFSEEAKFTDDYSLVSVPGFLSWFSEGFRQALVENDVPCYTEPVSGKTHHGPLQPLYLRARVFLLSAGEIGYEDLRFGNEGYRFSLFNEPRMRYAVPTARALRRGADYVYNDIAFFWYLRSRLNGQTRCQSMVFACEHKVGDVNNFVISPSYCKAICGIRPALCLDPAVQVTDEPDEDGVYTMLF